MDNILIIEEEKALEILKAYLEKAGYSVYFTTNGTEGLKFLHNIV